MGDLATEGRSRSNLGIRLIKLRRYDEARRELLRAIECKQPYGHASEPWKTFGILCDLERAVGNRPPRQRPASKPWTPTSPTAAPAAKAR